MTLVRTAAFAVASALAFAVGYPFGPVHAQPQIVQNQGIDFEPS